CAVAHSFAAVRPMRSRKRPPRARCSRGRMHMEKIMYVSAAARRGRGMRTKETLLEHGLRLLVLLGHKLLRKRPCLGAAQHGQRDRRLASAMMRRRRNVAIEFGT